MLTIACGSTFQLLGRFLFDAVPVDSTGWGQVRLTLSDFTGNQFATLNFEWLDITLGIARVWADDTSAWPVGRVRIDCEVTDSYGQVMHAVADYFRMVESTLNGRPQISA
jgi:hypothetical protein